MSFKHNLLKVLSILAILAMTFSNFQVPVAQAQSGDGLKRQVNAESHRVSFIGPASGRMLPASKALGTSIRPQDPGMALAKRYAHEFGLKNPERDLAVMKKKHENNGRSTIRYQQKYNGIPVMAGELIVNTDDDGNLYSMNGEVSPDLSLDTTPTIDAKQAQSNALQSMAKWYQKNPDDFTTTEPELWIFDESLLQPSTRPVELVWRMEVRPKEITMPVRELVLVNAQRGMVSFHFNQVDAAWGGRKQKSAQPRPTAEPPLPVDASGSISSPLPTIETAQSSRQTADDVTALGATLYVATTGDNANDCETNVTPCATINAALGKAASGDTIKVAQGTYTSSGTEVVLINKSIMLSGGWNSSFTAQDGTSTIDGQGTRRGMTVNSGFSVTIEKMVIQNGNTTFAFGGGIYNHSNTTLVINNSTLNGNKSGWGGGAIFNDTSGILTLNNSIISNNVDGISNYGAMTVINSTIINNAAVGANGRAGIYNDSASTLTLNNSVIDGNQGRGIENYGTLTINSSTISNNTSWGIIHENGILTLNNSTVTGNTADFYGSLGKIGGGLLIGSNATFYSTTTTLNNTTVSNNSAERGGEFISWVIVRSL